MSTRLLLLILYSGLICLVVGSSCRTAFVFEDPDTKESDL